MRRSQGVGSARYVLSNAHTQAWSHRLVCCFPSPPHTTDEVIQRRRDHLVLVRLLALLGHTHTPGTAQVSRLERALIEREPNELGDGEAVASSRFDEVCSCPESRFRSYEDPLLAIVFR